MSGQITIDGLQLNTKPKGRCDCFGDFNLGNVGRRNLVFDDFFLVGDDLLEVVHFLEGDDFFGEDN